MSEIKFISRIDKMEKRQNRTADSFKIVGNWPNQAEVLKDRYSQLTDSDLKFEAGQENDLLKRMETRLNKNREEVINIIRKSEPRIA